MKPGENMTVERIWEEAAGSCTAYDKGKNKGTQQKAQGERFMRCACPASGNVKSAEPFWLRTGRTITGMVKDS